MLRSLLLFFLRILRTVLANGAPQSVTKQTNAELTRTRATQKPSRDSAASRPSTQSVEAPSDATDGPTALTNPTAVLDEQESALDPDAQKATSVVTSGEVQPTFVDREETLAALEPIIQDNVAERPDHFVERAEFDASVVNIEKSIASAGHFVIAATIPDELTCDGAAESQRLDAHEPESQREVTAALSGAEPSLFAAAPIVERSSSGECADGDIQCRDSTKNTIANEAQSSDVSTIVIVPVAGCPPFSDDDHGTGSLSAEERHESIRDPKPIGARSSVLRRMPSREVTTEPFIGLVTPVSDAYSIWNRAIIRSSLQHSETGDEIYLSTTPSVLAATLNDSESTFFSADEAAAQFIGAVREMYQSRVLPHARKLETLRRCGGDGLPECAAFLALSVLAAYRMHTDEGTAATAYYKRLDELLCCGISPSGMPVGFDGDDFHNLWAFLGAWLSRERGRRLAMPHENAGPRRFLALPLTHVPLREVDIERLPTFFDWARCAPGKHVASDALNTALLQWVRSYGGFTRAGNDALVDDRKSAVIAQVTQELASWDGSTTDAQGRRTAPVEIYLHWRRRMPILSYLPRRPAVFPATFDDGDHILDAGQNGWYEPSEINADESELLTGFSWETSVGGLTFVLRRYGSEAIAMAPSEFEGPISHGALVMGAPGAVVCADSVLPQVSPYLERITGKRCARQPAPGIRAGWTLIGDVRPVRRESPPPGLESLAIESNVEIVASGGLRLGSRRAWIADAPPRLSVTGYEPGDEIRLDDARVTIDDDGAIVDDGRLALPGSHVIYVGHARYRLDTVKPEVAASLSERSRDADLQKQYVVALPAGCWTIIGSHQSDVARAASNGTQRSILRACTFRPVWAISVRSREAVVRRLTPLVPYPAPFVRKTVTWAMSAWANAIYAAHVRHPKFESEAGAPEFADATWLAYAQASKNIKRALKATRR
jgi:hypothetical protein